jgi:hypothetical protein
MKKVVWTVRLRAAIVFVAAAAATSCGDLQRQGMGSSYLLIRQFDGASGAEPEEFGNGILYSDVVTFVKDQEENLVPTIFSDLGRVRFSLAMKDPGGSTSPSAPTSANFITLNRYRVRYIRADGRNTPGVDVPYPFDGGLSLTVGTGEVEAVFEIVRHAAKMEAPLGALAMSPVTITTIGEVTFYGRDQTGREVIATGTLTVEFGNFGDPSS